MAGPQGVDAADVFVFVMPATLAGNDARVGATVPDTTAAMKAAGKTFDPVTYDGAGHGFMRAGEDPANTVPGNKTAREEGFAEIADWFETLAKAEKSHAGRFASGLQSIS